MVHNYLYNLKYPAMFAFITIVLSSSFLVGNHSMDEIWNFQYARRIMYGYTPYKDFSIAVLPFSAQVNAAFLSLCSDNLIVIRFIGIMVSAITGTIVYAILNHLAISTPLSIFCVLLYVSFVSLLPENNYSWYAVMFLSIALFVEVQKIANQYHKAVLLYDVIIGCLLGLTTISKHNVGIIGLLGALLYAVLCGLHRLHDDEHIHDSAGTSFKNSMLTICYRMSGWSLVVVAEFIYLYMNSALGAFVDHNVKSVSSIADILYVPYTNLFLGDYALGLKVLALLLPLMLLIALLYGIFVPRTAHEKYIFIVVAIYSLVNFSVIFPTADSTHFIFAIPLSVIAIALLLRKCKPTLILYTAIVLFGLIITTSSLVKFLKLRDMLENQSDIKIRHYLHIPFESDIKQDIKDVGDFIVSAESSGKRAYILDFRAALYLIPLDKFDSRGETLSFKNGSPLADYNTIRMLSNSSNIVVFIRGRNSEPNWLEQKDLATFVRNNMHFVASIGSLDVFEK